MGKHCQILYGTENSQLAYFQPFLRRGGSLSDQSFRYGKSVSNQTRMGYTRRMGTTARPPVPQGLYDECRIAYLRDIETIVK